MNSSDELLFKLLSIASIKKGETLSTTTCQPIEKSYWSTTLSRTYNRENRKKSVSYIKDVVEQALKIVKYNSNDENKLTLTDALNSCLPALENLKETYKGDYEICGAISTIINLIKPSFTEVFVDVTNHELFDAIKNKNYDYIEKYLYDGKDVNIKTIDGQNALHIAVDKKYYDKQILNLLLSFNIDLTCKDIEGSTPVYVAVTTGCCEAVLMLEDCIAKKKRDHIV